MFLAHFAALALAAAPPMEVHHELSLSPNIQLNSRWSLHAGTDLRYTYWVRPPIGVYGAWLENWVAGPSRGGDELLLSGHADPGPSATALLRRAGFAGIVVAPQAGVIGETRPFQVTFDVGAGYAQRAYVVRNIQANSIELLDIGGSLVGTAGFGVRFRLSDRFAVSAALRDTFTNASVDQSMVASICGPKDIKFPTAPTHECTLAMDGASHAEPLNIASVAIGVSFML